MSVAKIIEITAEADSVEAAITQGVERASRTVDNIQSVWVKEIHGRVEGGEVTAYRVDLKITFLLSD